MMTSNPLVCCVMLANGRPEMVKRAVRCFDSQTYLFKQLLIWNNGTGKVFYPSGPDSAGPYWICEGPKKTIGEMRNDANAWAIDGPTPIPDVLIHWDSDDWSHPWRIQEQVALLQGTGRDCVGYRNMLFWRTGEGLEGDAWMWSEMDPRKPLGTSLCYKREAWERTKFLAAPNNAAATSEYYHWLKTINAFGVSSMPDYHGERAQRPRMIASIHGANSAAYDPADYVANNRGTTWGRAPSWDDFCRETMTL